MNSHTTGFTLVELMVVLLVLALGNCRLWKLQWK
ncbi:MAG: prepilin-type N-terminal cleavage/methylation domain-containing protein [Methylococcaceae bacterium]|nr:prepilin-type N-terminal cleavage/methylation domain-containing protein [Methylococcaceae bacterium]